MKRFMSMCAVILTAVALAMTGAATAGASMARTIDCAAPVYNDTVHHGKFDVDVAYIEREIAMFKAFAPAAKVYVHAYEHIPGGSLDAFMDMARQQCSDWNTNTIGVVYGRDIDDIAIYRSTGFMPIDRFTERILKGVKIGLGPDTTQVSSDAVTSVLVDTLIGARHYLAHTHFYDEKAGIYVAPIRDLPDPEQPVPLPVMIGLVIAGFVGFGLFARWLGRLGRR